MLSPFVFIQKLIAQPFAELRFQHITTEDALSNPHLTNLYMDGTGILWIGSENGLTKFDGISTTTYVHQWSDTHSVAANYIVQMIEDSMHNLWIGSQNGLSYYHRFSNKFFNYKSFTADQPIAPNFYAYPFYIDHRQQLWAYLSGSIFSIDIKDRKATFVSNLSNGRIFTPNPMYGTLTDLYTNNNVGMFQIALQADSVVQYASFFRGKDDIPLQAKINEVQFYGDSIAIIASDEGLIFFNTHTQQYRYVRTFAGSQIFVHSLAVSSYNPHIFYVGTAKHGILVLDALTEKNIYQYKHIPNDQQSISGDDVRKIIIDKKGNLFCIIGGKGVDYTNILSTAFAHYLRNSEPTFASKNNVSQMCLAGGKLWIGTNDAGIYMMDTIKFSVEKTLLPNLGIDKMIQISAEKIFVLSHAKDAYIIQTSNANIQKLTWTAPLPTSNFVIEDIDVIQGQIKAATSYGLFEFQINHQNITAIADTIINKSVEWPYFQSIIPIDTSQYLLQAFYTNLYLVDGKNIQQIDRTPFKSHDYHRTHSQVILATSEGIVYYDIHKKSLRKDTAFQTYAYGISVDSNDVFWITTPKGLVQYDTSKQVLQRFGLEDGLQHYIFNIGTNIQTGNSIILGGINGINVFHPQDVAIRVNNYEGIITQIKVNEQAIDSFNPRYLNELKLSHTENNLEFTISPLTFQNAVNASLQYQLVGMDPLPVMVTGKHAIRYPSLPPGNYTFILQGNTGSKQQIQIEIQPAFWQTSWFNAMLILFICGIVFAIYKWRSNQIKARQYANVKLMIASQEEERKRIARDLHDDFGARLSTLKLYVNHEKSADNNSKQAVSHLIDGAIAELRNILFNLSPKVLEENGLKAALIEICRNLNKLQIIDCNLDIHHFKGKLDKQTEYSIYRISQELINNTLKHANATEINISMVEHAEEIIYLYEDNGQGFDLDKIVKGYGWNNVRMHAKVINATLYVDAAPGRGVAVTIHIPVLSTQ